MKMKKLQIILLMCLPLLVKADKLIVLSEAIDCFVLKNSYEAFLVLEEGEEIEKFAEPLSEAERLNEYMEKLLGDETVRLALFDFVLYPEEEYCVLI